MSTCLARKVFCLMPAGQAGFLFNLRIEYLILLALICMPALVYSGSLSVTPLRVELSKSESTRVINLQNLESKPVTVQLQVMAWSQKDGVDHFVPTRDVIVTPQVFQLNANSLQIIRAGLMRKPDVHEELSYRLFIEEIPEPPPPNFRGAQLALKVSLPVFITPEKTPIQKLEFQTSVQVDGKLKVTIVNHGQAHAQLQKMAIFAADKSEPSLVTFEKLLYVLPGQEKHVLLKSEARDLSVVKQFFISAITRHGPVESHVSTGSP